VQRSASRLRGDVVLHFAEAGSFDELRGLVAEVRPHVLHLSGHGVVGPDSVDRFFFEDERGRTDRRTAADVVTQVLRGTRSVRCVVLNACQSSQAAASGLCQALVAAGLPLAVGWAASVADDLATDFVAAVYNGLLRGEPLPSALAHARLALRNQGRAANPTGAATQEATFGSDDGPAAPPGRRRPGCRAPPPPRCPPRP
jgi:CHAT domain-containing protein